MVHRPATEAIVAQAKACAQQIDLEYGWQLSKAEECGVLKAYITEMERNDETPTEYARRQGWIE